MAKVHELAKDIHKITDKYNSEIFNSIIDKMVAKIER